MISRPPADPASLAAAGLFAAVLLAATWTDLRARRIPNGLTLPAVLAALALAAWSGALASAVAGLVAGAAIFILPMLLYGAANAGGGDVKLAAFLGAALGLAGVMQALLVGGLVASAVVLAGLATRRLSRRSRIPYGPFLAIGGLAALFLG